MRKEQEIKIELKNPAEISRIKARIEKLYGPGVTEFQKTYFFSELGIPNTFLRVRKEGTKGTVTLKIKGNKKSKVFERDEYEVQLKDATQINEMVNIFKKLGFSGVRILEKIRTNWYKDDESITMDHLSFGDYIEIEAKENRITEIVKELKLEKKERIVTSYWDLYEKKCGKHKNCLLK